MHIWSYSLNMASKPNVVLINQGQGGSCIQLENAEESNNYDS